MNGINQVNGASNLKAAAPQVNRRDTTEETRETQVQRTKEMQQKAAQQAPAKTPTENGSGETINLTA